MNVVLGVRCRDQKDQIDRLAVIAASPGAFTASDLQCGIAIPSPTPKGKVVNSVGAGDSMVAGFLAGYLASEDYEQAFRMGMCTGSASAFSEELATKEEVEALMKATFGE